MRTGITILNAGGKMTVIHDVTVPVHEQRSAFRAGIKNPPSGEYEVQLWESTRGITKRRKFNRVGAVTESVETPEPQEPPSVQEQTIFRKKQRT